VKVKIFSTAIGRACTKVSSKMVIDCAPLWGVALNLPLISRGQVSK